MGRTPRANPQKPHGRAESRRRAAIDPDQEWADQLYERMLGDCHPFQRDAVEDPALRISYLVGRGGGKTTAARVRALRKITSIRRAKVAYVATSRPEAERLNWEPLKQLIEDLGESDNFEFSESKMRCTCKRTGGTYQFFGADDKKEINKLRGQPFNELQIDEAASHDPKLLSWLVLQAVGPRLGERHGCILILGTPGNLLYGLFYDVTRPVAGDDAIHRPYRRRDDYPGWIGWSSHAWNAPEVLALPDAETKYPALYLNWQDALRTKARERWGDDNPIWLREYMGQWARDDTTSMYAYRAHDAAGAPLNQWDPLGTELAWVREDGYRWGEAEAADWPKLLAAACAALRAAIAKLPAEFTDYLFGYGQDLGARDPYALDIFALSPSDPLRRRWHVFSFGRRKMYARLMADLLIGEAAAAAAARGETYKAGGLFEITDWSVAIVADLAGLGEVIIDEMQNVYGIKMRAAEKKGKHGAIETVNGGFADRQVFIIKGSPLEAQLATLQWQPDEYGQPREDKAARNDHADAATYILPELSALFAAPPAKDKPKADARAPAPPPRAKSPPTGVDDPYGGRQPRGEFDSLLAEGSWTGLD